MCFRINFWKWISSIFERIWSSIPQQTPPRAVPSCAGFGNLRITKEPNGTLNLGVAIFPPKKKGWRFCWWKKSCTTSDVKFIKIPCKWWDKLPIRTYKLVQGFLPSAVCHILASSYGGHCSRVLRYPVYTEGGFHPWHWVKGAYWSQWHCGGILSWDLGSANENHWRGWVMEQFIYLDGNS